MTHMNFSAGETIFQQHDMSDCAYLILSGKVDILYEADGEVEASLITSLSEGQIFGEMGLVDEAPRSASARAKTDTVLEAVDHDGFVKKLIQNPQDCVKYLHVLFERLRSSNTRGHIEKPVESAIAPQQQFHIVIKPLTDQAQEVIPDDAIMVQRLPYGIGRVSKSNLESNDLEIADVKPYQVSRHHLCFERHENHVVIRDRGSFRGTRVNGQKIGGQNDVMLAVLAPGENEIVVGGSDSPYRFKATLHLNTPEG
jgi:CRP-like cAMP-binding protein